MNDNVRTKLELLEDGPSMPRKQSKKQKRLKKVEREQKSKVKIIDEESDQETNYQIVGPYEANLEKGLISVASPMAKALIGKEVGMSVAVTTPGGTKNYEILTIEVPKS